MRQTVVIGGGASGMTAAVFAAREGDQVALLEHTDVLGKKLLSTGNGRCNLTNRIQEPSCYHSENESFPFPALKRFGYGKTLQFFRGLGLFFKDRDGYLYPRSFQASAVREALLSELSRLEVDIRTNCVVEEIKAENGRFLVKARDNSFAADAVVLACGGKAAPATGSDGSGYGLACSLGHRMILPVPALTGLLASPNPLKKAAGVRADGTITLYIGEKEKKMAGEDTGELQITDYGISGIPAFQVSRYASRALAEGKMVQAQVNFFSEYEKREAKEILAQALDREGDCFQNLCGLFPEKLSAVFLKKTGLPVHIPSKRLEKRKKQQLSELICSFPLNITAVNDFSRAQVTAGGINTDDVWPETMESRLFPGLYFAGEILDVDGNCGGYNLQWAWASGFLAGKQGRL